MDTGLGDGRRDWAKVLAGDAAAGPDWRHECARTGWGEAIRRFGVSAFRRFAQHGLHVASVGRGRHDVQPRRRRTRGT